MSDQKTARNVFFGAATAGAVMLIPLTALTQEATDNTGDQASAAVDLVVEAACDNANPGERVAIFSWVSRGASQTEIDVTQYYNGWNRGQFETIARLEGGTSQFSWRGGDPGIDYLWRVRTYVNGTWRASAPARYQTPVCPVDYGPGIEDGAEPDPVK